MNDSLVHLRLLGLPEVRIGEKVFPLTLLDKPWALMVYLAVECRAQDRSALAGLFWPDKSERAGRSNLSSTLYLLEKRLGGPLPLVKDPEHIQWMGPESGEETLDLHRFLSDRPPHGCSRLHDPAVCPACRSLLSRRLSLWRGPFLEGGVLPESVPFREWVEKLRDQVASRRQALKLYLRLPGRDPSEPSPSLSGSHSLWERRHIVLLSFIVTGPLRMEPEEALEGQRLFHSAAASILRNFGGWLMPSPETSIQAIFGYPQAREDSARRAVHAAGEVLRAFGVLAASGLEIRAGLHAGVGTVDLSRDCPDATGDRCRETNRVAREASPGELVASIRVIRLLAGIFRSVSLGKSVIDHSGRSLELFLIMEEEFQDTYPPRSLIGREKDLLFLGERWREAENGPSRTVWITGEAGIGKTALVSGFLRQMGAGSEGVPNNAWRLVCKPEFGDRPWGPVVRNLRRKLGINERTSLDEKRYRAERALLKMRQPVADTLPLFLEFLDGPKEIDRKGSDGRRQGMEELLLRLATHEMMSHRPVIVVEDLQWADPFTVQLLLSLFSLGTRRSFFILTARRLNTLEALSLPAPDRSLELGPIDRTSSRFLAESLSVGKIEPRRLREILDLGDGVPLYLCEMVRGGFPDGEEKIPDTLRDLLASRIEELGESQGAAKVAACLGHSFPRSLLLAVEERLNGPDSRAKALLHVQGLLEAGVVEEDVPGVDPVWIFHHNLFRESLLVTLPPIVRREIHRAIVSTIESTPTVRGTLEPEILEYHLRLSGDSADMETE